MIGSELYKKYFVAEEQDERAELEEAGRRRGMWREFVTREGYREFREFLRRAKKANRPSPGGAEAVNYQLGVVHGLEMIEDQLDNWEEQVRE